MWLLTLWWFYPLWFWESDSIPEQPTLTGHVEHGPTDKDRLDVKIRAAVRSDLPISHPRVRTTDSGWVERAAAYRDFSDIERQTRGQPFDTALEALSGLNQFAYQRYEASLSFKEIELKDILSQKKHYKSDNISAVLTEVADDLGFAGFTSLHLDPESGIAHSFTLVSEKKGGKLFILDRDRVIETMARDVEDAMEQWSYYSGRVSVFTNLYSDRGENVYIGINELGRRIRPTAMNFPFDPRPQLEMLLHDEQIALGFFLHNVGLQVGAIRGYGPLDWGPFLRIAGYRKYVEPAHTAEYYLDTSYMRGGGGLYYFRQKQPDGSRRDRVSLLMDLGSEFAVSFADGVPYQSIIGIDYLNDWGPYYDIVRSEFEIESIPSGAIELKLGLRRNFEAGDLAFHVTPYAIGRYSSYSLQNPLPFVYGIYGLRTRLFYLIGEGSHLLLDAKAQAAILREHLYREWYAEVGFEQWNYFAIRTGYYERTLMYHTLRRAFAELSAHLETPLQIFFKAEYRFDERRYEITAGIDFEDL